MTILSGHMTYWVTVVIFTVTYLGLAWGGLPGLRIDRAGIAMAGAAAMLGVGAIAMHDAAAAVDAETVVLLLGMMIVVTSLQLAGFFAWATDLIATHFSGAYTLLAMTIALSGCLSALLVNDVVCVALTPLVLSLCLRLKRPPLPYLIGLATASNIGSVATITGNPQNIIIGSLSGISYLRFASRLAPVAVIGLLLNFAIVALVYRRQLRSAGQSDVVKATGLTHRSSKVHRRLLVRSLLITGATVALFFAGFPIAIVALCAAALTLLSGVRSDKYYRRIDWALLLMFSGLFIVVRAFEVNVVRTWGLDQWAASFQQPVLMITGLSVVLSNLVSNVPAVLLFRSLIPNLADPEAGWLTLAMSSTLAGNLTLLGSVANLIVVETARRAGIVVSFFEYLKVGVVLTVLTTIVGVLWLMFTRY
ncbi:anion transporter [Planctomicrobium piriforme]|uniref:Na+/H+ antiporter NhaD n=1 Tax=Planctomicrobium piriforme TaxID=1576369 RepID=A0A1I3FV46_9PLAN|nr:anion transporter [Planctomicrobium piriforme]SFI15113.1 Na+/H+ antiporter NhaD [Planctomicrobium piriforme]